MLKASGDTPRKGQTGDNVPKEANVEDESKKTPQGDKGPDKPREANMEKYIRAATAAQRDRLARNLEGRKAAQAYHKAKAKAKADKAAAQAIVAGFRDLAVRAEALRTACATAEAARKAKVAARKASRWAAQAARREAVKGARREAAAHRAQVRANARALALVMPTRQPAAWVPAIAPIAVGVVNLAEAVAQGVALALKAEAAALEVQEFLRGLRAEITRIVRKALRAVRAEVRAAHRAAQRLRAEARGQAAQSMGRRIGAPMDIIPGVKADRALLLNDAGYTREEWALLQAVRAKQAKARKAEVEALRAARAELKALKAAAAAAKAEALKALAALRQAVQKGLRARNGFEMNASGITKALRAVKALGLEPRGQVRENLVLLGYGDMVA